MTQTIHVAIAHEIGSDNDCTMTAAGTTLEAAQRAIFHEISTMWATADGDTSDCPYADYAEALDSGDFDIRIDEVELVGATA